MSSGDIDYLYSQELKPLALRIQHEILDLAAGIVAAQRINFKVFIYQNSQEPGINRIAALRFYRNFFRLHAHRIQANGRLDVDDPYPFVELQRGSENYYPMIAIIKASLRHLGAEI